MADTVLEELYFLLEGYSSCVISLQSNYPCKSS